MKRDVDRNAAPAATTAGTEHEQLIRRLLADPTKKEALEWLKSGVTDESRIIGACETKRDSFEFVRGIYDLGALAIVAVNIQPRKNGRGERTGKLVVTLPQNPKQRSAIFEWCKSQGDSLGFTPDPDRGENHLFLLLD